jgi:hypothetical protein
MSKAKATKPINYQLGILSRTTPLIATIPFPFNMPAVDKCPKCGKPAWKPDLVTRYGKDPERAYKYNRYRHPLDGRTKRNKACYVRVGNDS